MAEVKDSTATHNKTLDKHNTVADIVRACLPLQLPPGPKTQHPVQLKTPALKDFLSFVNPIGYSNPYFACKVPPDPRVQSGFVVAPPGAQPGAVPLRPPLNRVDSRTAIPNPAPRPVGQPVPPQQQRPQFQPGGPVNNPPQFAPRPGTPAPRGPAPAAPLQLQRPVAPLQRPSGPPPTAPQQLIRGPQPPLGAPPQRAPVPINLQFGPRQPPQLAVPTTPDGTRPPLVQTYNGVRNGAPQGSNLRPLLDNQRPPLSADLTRQQPGLPKGPDTQNTNQINRVTLDNQNSVTDYAGTNRPEKLAEPSGLVAKNRSYSIAGPAAASNPFATDEFRRNSISAVSGRPDEGTTRGSELGSIYEGKPDVKDSTIRGSKESVRSDASNESRDLSERPESRKSGSKMSESFIGSFKPSTPKKKPDDDDDVILQNNKVPAKVPDYGLVNKTEIYDRSPSLTRSDESPESKQSSVTTNKAMPIPKQNVAPEIQRVITPNDNKVNETTKDIKASNAILNNISKPTEPKSPTQTNKKPTELYTDSMKSTPRRVASAPKSRPKDGDNDSGVDESTQGNDTNGSPSSPNKKTPSKLPTKASNGVAAPSLSRSSSKSATAKTPENPLPTEKKKVPMNKVQVGNAPSPNIKAVKSKIGSLNNTTYKPGGGKVKIENRKLDFQKVTPRIAAKNDAYVPSGGTKKITTTKLEWNAKSKIGSLENSTYKPGGGDKKIESVKLDFKEKAKPKVASTVNITHKPGGGAVKSTNQDKIDARSIENQKLEFKAESKVGSLDNVKHKPGGGEIKIFDDKDYIKNISGHSPALSHSGQESPIPPAAHAPKADINLNQQPY